MSITSMALTVQWLQLSRGQGSQVHAHTLVWMG